MHQGMGIACRSSCKIRTLMFVIYAIGRDMIGGKNSFEGSGTISEANIDRKSVV